MKIKAFCSSLAIFAVATSLVAADSFSGEDLGTTVKNTAGDISTAAKKTGRWGARQGRKVVGADSKSKDTHDSMENNKDNAINDAKKASNKSKEEQ